MGVQPQSNPAYWYHHLYCLQVDVTPLASLHKIYCLDLLDCKLVNLWTLTSLTGLLPSCSEARKAVI